MKIKIMTGAAVLVVLGVAAFVVAGDGEDLDKGRWEKLRGTEAYYADGEPILAAAPFGEEDVMVNLADGKVAKVGFDLKYRVGKEWLDEPALAAEAIAAKQNEIRSALIVLLTGKSSKDFSGANLRMLFEEILQAANDVVFPLRRARFESIILKNMITQ